MKANDDVYLRLEQLAASLNPLPRRDLYYGFVIPCQSMNPFVHYISGMGFVLSWDLVEWIGASLIPLNHTVGPEDKLVGEWLNRGDKAKNRVSNKPAMYDYPRTNGRCSHDLVPTPSRFFGSRDGISGWMYLLSSMSLTRLSHLRCILCD
ncbi:hypothetical protein SASPL_137960 [Salvia splendens]|uniref:Hexosyltransferase n=1 Tax=Salvia splendens TaxID=180675 RepID=A0A8X8WSN0_SALSN|nr:hypothetical protein SASPL_137960 [Salvia splendens]